MKATIIHNPAAGQNDSGQRLRRIVADLESQGWRISMRETTPRMSAQKLAEQARDDGAQVVVAAGGDGTINGVVNGLVNSEVVLGILPTGTANVWAQESGLNNPSPLGDNLEHAARVLLEGNRLRLDLGKAGDRHFLLMAGIGLDGIVTERVDKRVKARFGALAYAWTAVREAFRYRGAVATIILDDREITRRIWLLTVSNSKNYARVPLATDASVTDGLLNVGIFEGSSWRRYLRHLVSVMLRRHKGEPNVEFHTAKQIEINTIPQLPVHVDAEPMGYTPMRFEVVPSALTVIVPSKSAEKLSKPLD
ncbi:MAG: diacylglycerol kinase family lipid kinase [Anaerolineales bacterium]|nr:diacylglycerol kinase family lipid kinase [Anaerolineales bacterium]MCB9127397.1 diacylglycerol kinase family lipid kinase [Ardenticatenales bacterium]